MTCFRLLARAHGSESNRWVSSRSLSNNLDVILRDDGSDVELGDFAHAIATAERLPLPVKLHMKANKPP
jgi:hypothetical protein